MFVLARALAAVSVLAVATLPAFAAGTVAPRTFAQASPTTTLATVQGIVTDSQGGAVANADVAIVGPGRYEAHTSANGAFTVANVKPGLYSIRVSRAGYGTAVQDDVAVAAGTSNQVNATLVSSSTQSLRLIGTVTTTAGRNRFNVSGLSVTTLDNAQIAARVQPNLKDELSELPGVAATHDSGGRSPNSNFMVRGASIESKVTIDGHAISSGVFGTYNNNYANSEIFEQVEVLKGAGLNGVNAGESAFGTINLRTRNFLPTNGIAASLSADSYGTGWLNFLANYNVGKWSFLAGRSYQSYNGPNQGVMGQVINNVGGPNLPRYPAQGPALIQWVGELANPYSTEADLVKARVKFSSATWLTGEWLNLTGRYFNQGGSYAYYNGVYTVPQCFTAGAFVPAGGSGCDARSLYNPPFLSNLIGTTQPLYSYFPRSNILNNEPQFSAELRTTHKQDTILLRPYRTQIKRFIDGSAENTQPGYGGGWYQVTNAANCQAVFTAPPGSSPSAGAKGPCFFSDNGYAAPFIGAPDPTHPVVFVTTPTAPSCSVDAPCWTTPTAPQRNGYYGFNTPFSQPEVDRLSGATFSYLHPVGLNLYTFNVDYSRDNTLKFTADNSALPAGCFPTVTSAPNLPTLNTGAPNPYYQPACTIGGMVLPRTPGTALQIPPTTNYKTAYSLTGLFQLTPRLQVGLGNYLTIQKLDYVFTDPAAAAAAGSLRASNGQFLTGAEQADATLVRGVATHTHYDPHLQVQYRASSNASLRMTAGSSITMPYASLVSGFVKLTPNGGPTGNTDFLSIPNPNLQPETTIAYDLGADFRLHDGTIVSTDLFNNTIHNVFITVPQIVPNLPGRVGIAQTIQTNTLNGPLERDFGAELTVQRAPLSGLGYFLTGTLQRAYYDGFSTAFYQTLANNQILGGTPANKVSFVGLVNGQQLQGTTFFTGQVPFFKSKLEVNYRTPLDRAYYALGTVINGANNSFGIPAFNTWYGNATWNLGHAFAVTLSGENLMNFNSGSFTGNVVNNAGFSPIGVRWRADLGTLEYGPANNFPFVNNGAVVIPPRNLYLTLTKRL
ncbi:MAG: hypothetical protein NVS1B14_00820 [Vulcanimicrobiaceae bacterium]